MEAWTATSGQGRNRLGRRIMPWFVLLGGILFAISLLIFNSVSELIASSGWVAHSYQVLDNLDLTEDAFTDAQSDERGYVATCNRALISPFRSDIPRIYGRIAILRSLVADNPAQEQRAGALSRIITQELSRMSTVVAVNLKGRQLQAEGMVADKQNMAATRQILSIINRMEHEERVLVAGRLDKVRFFANLTLGASALGIFACFAILGLVFWLIRRETKRREASEESLYRTNERLQDSLSELQQHNSAARAVALLGELLQTCRNVQEALAISGRHLIQLFPGLTGTIGLFSNSRDVIAQGQILGDATVFAGEFAPDSCWGLRRGRIHSFAPGGSEPRCEHIHADLFSLCIPMTAQGETLGVVSLGASRGFSDIELRTIQTIAEQLSLAVANLRLQETLRNQSLRDPLTGLFNRRYLDDALVREIARARRHGKPLAVVMMDIDHFKRFNDTHGHEGGDVLLATFGRLLAGHVRGEDFACRYGGEEFALILPGATVADAMKRAEELRQATAGLEVNSHGTPLGRVTLSLGVAAFPAQGQTGSAVVAAADQALYAAKKAGRDRSMAAGNFAAGNLSRAG